MVVNKLKCIEKFKRRAEAVIYNGKITPELRRFLEKKEGVYYFENNRLYIYNELNKIVEVCRGNYLIYFENGLFNTLDKEMFDLIFEKLES